MHRELVAVPARYLVRVPEVLAIIISNVIIIVVVAIVILIEAWDLADFCWLFRSGGR